MVLHGVLGSLLAQIAPPVAPPENPITPEKSVLGKILFWEEQLSSDNTVACGTCHRPQEGGADLRFIAMPGPDGIRPSPDDLFGSPGVIRSDSTNSYEPDPLHGFLPQATDRNSPSFVMAAYFDELFWDGRATSQFIDPQTGAVSIASGGALESQAIAPVLSSVEMAHAGRDWSEATDKLAASHPLALATNLTPDILAALAVDPTYPDLFEAAFGDPAITAERIAFALATYQRALVPDDTPWDRFDAGDATALTPRQVAGLNLFTGRANCSKCHTTGLFTDLTFRNIGLRDPATDPGRKNVTGADGDRGKFKVPSLRNVGLRNRLMHTGQFLDVNQVVGFYDRGGDFADNRDADIVPLRLTRRERDELVDFVANGLNDARMAAGQAPFDRPTLRSEVPQTNPRVFGPATAGSGGLLPSVIANVAPNIGNVDFRFGLTNALGGAPVYGILAWDDVPSGTRWGKVTVNIDLSQIVAVLATDAYGAGPGGGYATFGASLPDDPTLIGGQFYAQWFVLDAGATGKVASSPGIEFTLF